MSKKLTPKQQMFVERYLVHFNATQAAKEAKYSEKTAYSVGHENLNKPEIQRAISEGQKAISERNQVDQDWIVKRLMIQADSRMSRVAYAEKGEIHLKHEMEEEELDCLDSFSKTMVNGEKTESETIKWKVKDPTKSLELLGKHIGMWEKDNGNDGAGKESTEAIDTSVQGYLEEDAS